MELKEELNEEIWAIWQILLNSKVAYFYCNYFYNPKSIIETQYINQSIHLRLIRDSLWKSTIIELFKLFSESNNDHYSFKQFIKKLEENGKYASLKFDSIMIEDWKNLIKNNELLIKKVNILRSQFYAHTDRGKPDETSIGLSLKDAEILINLVEKIISDVYFAVFESSIIREIPLLNREDFELVKTLAEVENKRKEDLRNSILNQHP